MAVAEGSFFGIHLQMTVHTQITAAGIIQVETRVRMEAVVVAMAATVAEDIES